MVMGKPNKKDHTSLGKAYRKYSVYDAQQYNANILAPEFAERDYTPVEYSQYAQEQQEKIKPIIDNVSHPVLDKIHTWFFKIPTMARLFLTTLDHALSYSKNNFLPSKFGILGFAIYGAEFLFCLAKIAYFTFRTTKDTKDLPFAKRTWLQFKTVMQKDGLISDLINSGVWFGINLTCFAILTTGFAPLAITLAGFGFDLLHMSAIAGHNIYTNWKLKNKCKDKVIKEMEMQRMPEARLVKPEKALAQRIMDHANKTHRVLSTDPTTRAIQERDVIKELGLEDLHEKNRALKNAEKNVVSVAQNRLYSLSMLATFATGFTISVLIPPIAPVGALIAFGSGSVLIGLGKKMFDSAYSYLKPTPPVSLSDEYNYTKDLPQTLKVGTPITASEIPTVNANNNTSSSAAIEPVNVIPFPGKANSNRQHFGLFDSNKPNEAPQNDRNVHITYHASPRK